MTKKPEVDRKDEPPKSSPKKESTVHQTQPQAPQPQASPHKVTGAKRSDRDKSPELLAKRTPPSSSSSSAKANGKTTEKTESNGTKPGLPALTKLDEPMKQVKSPIKIMKNSDGRYQVLRGPSTLARSNGTPDNSRTTGSSKNSPPPLPPPVTPAEFSVVSIADSANSNGVKITLKQCTPGSTSSSSSSSSKKPKVISNVLLRNPTQSDKATTPTANIVEQIQEINKQEKQKRKVSFVDTAPPAKQPKKATEQTDKKQFLHSFRLTTKQDAASSNQEVSNSDQPVIDDKESVEAQVRNIINKNNSTNKEPSVQPTANAETPKKRPTEGKMNSTNIADRLGEAKQLISSDTGSQPQISSSNEPQQPIDVYAFPNDPPSAAVPAGAVKRKCPPGLPIFEIRKKHQQYQAGKKAGANTARGGGAVKCYRNQSAKPVAYAKPPPSPARVSVSTIVAIWLY